MQLFKKSSLLSSAITPLKKKKKKANSPIPISVEIFRLMPLNITAVLTRIAAYPDNVTETGRRQQLASIPAGWHGYFFASSHWLTLLHFIWLPTPSTPLSYKAGGIHPLGGGRCLAGSEATAEEQGRACSAHRLGRRLRAGRLG